MTLQKLKISPIAAAISIGLGSLSFAAFSQDATDEEDKASNDLFEVIEVKARKMRNAEPIQDTPLSITAFGEDQLDALNATDLTDLTYTAPNVQFEEVGTFPGIQNFSFRGQGINSSIPSVDPTVGTFVDGVFIGTSYGVIIDMFDIESVEVLRGPQGLLFGRNVTGGAVTLRTKRPDEDFNARFKAGITNEDEYTIAGTVEGTLVDSKLRGKLVVYHNDDGGYFDYVGTGRINDGSITYFTDNDDEIGSIETTFARGTLVFDATDDLELTLIAETGQMDGAGAAWQGTSGILDAASGEYLGNPTGEFETSSDETGLTDGEWSQVTFETNYETENGVLTNILAYREIDFFNVVDIDGSSTPIFAVSGSTIQDQISNELRYAGSAMDGRLDYTLGHFYFEQDIEYLEGRLFLGGVARIALGGNMNHEVTGLFASGDYEISDKLTVNAGVRYTEEEKDAIVIDTTFGVCTDVFTFQGCQTDELSRKWDSWTPKLGVDYKINDDTLLYAFWTKGFRSGGVNFRNAKPERFSPGPTEQESQNAYEFGIKGEFLDQRLRFNTAFFFNDIKDMQREINVPDADVLVLQATLNAGDAEIKGMEVDFLGAVTENFTILGSLGVLDGEYTSKVPATADQFGDDLPRLAELTYGLSGIYNLELNNGGYIDFRLGYSFRDSVAYNDSNTAFLPEAKNVTFDITWTNADDNLSVSLYGKNLKDEARWGNLTGAANWGPMQKGRVLGVEVEYKLH